MDELLGRVTSRELSEWQAYRAMMPGGVDRLEHLLLQIALILCMAHEIKTKDKKDIVPQDLLLRPAESSKKGLTGKAGALLAKRILKHGTHRDTANPPQGPNRPV